MKTTQAAMVAETSNGKEQGDVNPKGLVVCDDDRKKVENIFSNNRSFLIQYLRKNHSIVIERNEETGKIERDKETGKINCKILHGAPTGAIIAICDNNKVSIGWSRRHTGKIRDTDGSYLLNSKNEPIDLEKAPFTKERARTIAALRAVLDGIEVMTGSSQKMKTKSGVIVPYEISDILPDFINRTKKFFGEDCQINNVS